MKITKIGAVLAVIGLIGGGFALPFFTASTNSEELVLGHGNVDALQGVYQQWQNHYQARGGDATQLRLPLAHSRLLSTSASKACGAMTLNLMTGAVTVKASGLEASAYDVWLVDNLDGPNRTVKPEAGDRFFRLGTLAADQHRGELSTSIDAKTLAGFNIDMVVMSLAGQSPDQSLVIAGAPDLLQRLYYADKLWAKATLGPLQAVAETTSAFAFLLPKVANAKSNGNDANLAAVMGAEIAEGRRLFTKETFSGNGRTCATCHRLDNNHTIDPKYIANLPSSDPLFVAETNPALKTGFENPKLMRELGLILANIDGFDKPGVMRSVPHTLALAKSIQTEGTVRDDQGVLLKGEFDLDLEFAHALGWSGDGSVGTGSLREFAIGAVVQHFTKSLARKPGADFRLPTDAELNALEAYMLSLGRSDDINLSKMTFTSAIVQRGKVLFDQKNNPVDPVTKKPILGKSANCNGCHSNAGAISSTTRGNPTRDTGVEVMEDQAAVLLDPTTPMDGGIGDEDKLGWCADNDPDTRCNYGEGRFNTPPLIEAADTAPFFHNNSVSTLEEAVAFYNTDAFNNSPGHLTSSKADRTVKISSSQVVAVSLFLRTINALENIRNANKLDDQAMALNGSNGRELARLAMADTEDAIEVLTEGQLIPDQAAVAKLRSAYNYEYSAALSPSTTLRNTLLRKAKALKLEADALMVTRAP